MSEINNRNLYVTAHPDDLETMLGYHAAQSDEAIALVATAGRASSVNYTADPCFCRAR